MLDFDYSILRVKDLIYSLFTLLKGVQYIQLCAVDLRAPNMDTGGLVSMRFSGRMEFFLIFGVFSVIVVNQLKKVGAKSSTYFLIFLYD